MRKIAFLLLCVSAITAIAGCSRVQTGNPVSDNALTAFNKLVAQNKDRKGFHDEMKHWGLSLPGDDKFEWTKDTSVSEIDFAIVVAAEPFISAGLDAAKLSGGGYVFREAATEGSKPIPNLLIYPYNVSDKKETAQGSEDAMRRILKQSPALVSYHAQIQQYRLMLSDGFEVRWTEAPGTGSADITFLIAADPLIDAGVDVTMLERSGWVYREAVEDSDIGSYPNQFERSYTLTAAK